MQTNKIILSFIALLSLLTGCQSNQKATLKVYNWGEYIDMDVIKDFEQQFDVKVIYDTFDSNEAMFNKISAGSVSYDVVFPSDYMAEKMIKADMLAPLDYSQIPNIQHIKPELLKADFDPQQLYSVPYFWGTVGILYDKTKVTEPVTSWNILWDDKYQDNILMYNSARDSMMVALKTLGYSMNTKNPDQIAEATALLKKQRPLVSGYVGDEVINNMINSQAALAVVYSGDATTIMKENPNMAYAIPKEGSNIWIDPVVISKNSTQVTLAHQFINYLSDPDAALLNTQAVGYSTPNMSALELLKKTNEPWIDWISYNPDLTAYPNLEYYSIGADDILKLYTDAWEQVINS